MVFARSSMVAMTLAAAMASFACGGDADEEGAGSPAGGATKPSAAVTTPAPTTPADGARSADVSEEGQTLALGKRVVAPYVVYGTGSKAGTQQKTTLGVTVLRVRKGKISDFKDFNLDKKQKNTVPYYVDVKYENLGQLRLKRFLLDPSIEDSEGMEYKPLNLIVLSGTFKKCPKPSRAPLPGGRSFTLCAPFLLPRGKTYERVRFQGDVTKDPYFWR